MRKFLTSVVLACLAGLACADASLILNGVAVTGAGSAVAGSRGPAGKTYQAYASTTAGTGTFVVNVECSNTGTGWDVLGTITLPALTTTASSNSFTSADRCSLVRGNVTTVTGTGTVGTLTMGY